MHNLGHRVGSRSSSLPSLGCCGTGSDLGTLQNTPPRGHWAIPTRGPSNATDVRRLQAIATKKQGGQSLGMRTEPQRMQGDAAPGGGDADRGEHSPLDRPRYSTVTDLARLRGLSTSVPRASAVW